MSDRTESNVVRCIGFDIGDRMSVAACISSEEKVLSIANVSSTPDGLLEFFSQFPEGTRVVCEAGTHSPWMSDILEQLGLDGVVVNPNSIGRAIAKSGKKNDRVDATVLGILGLKCLSLLGRIKHRGPEVRLDLTMLRTRCGAVAARTSIVNTIRGTVKSHGERIPSNIAAKSLHNKVLKHVSPGLAKILRPMVTLLASATATVNAYDKEIEALCAKYPETEKLRQITGVGPLIALAFLLTIDDAKRFRRSRDVGAYVGLVPRQHESGECSLQLRITKAGDSYMRQLLVQGAHYILGSFGPDCELRRFGQRVGARGGAKGKKRAVIAVARKLAVVMHRLLVTDEAYDPFYRKSSSVAASA